MCKYGTAASAFQKYEIKLFSKSMKKVSKNLLCEIRVKSKTFGDRAFEKMAPKLWNNLPKKH